MDEEEDEKDEEEKEEEEEEGPLEALCFYSQTADGGVEDSQRRHNENDVNFLPHLLLRQAG